MLDLQTETPISLSDAAKLLPAGRGGKGPYISTLLRWIVDGSKGPDGEVVRLEALRAGKRWITSKEALHRFMKRLTPQFGVEPALSLSQEPAEALA